MSKPNKILLSCLFLGYFFALIIIRTPATLVTVSLAKIAPQLQLAVIEGTAWSGKAGSAYLNYQGKTVDLGALNWRFRPLSLLLFKVCVDLESTAFNGNLCRTAGGINQLANAQFEVPINLIGNLIPEAKLGGSSSLSIVKGAINDNGQVSKLAGNLTWRDARFFIQGKWFTLGDFAADLVEAENGAIKADIFDISGPFGVRLSANVGVTTPLSLRGEVTPRDDAPEDLRDALGLFAVPQDNGSYTISFPLGS
jgi:predicted heme/steroid binding protein